jgi:5,10-methylenetetrahydrofolate reductase
MPTIVQRRLKDRDTVLFVCDFSPPRGPDPKFLESARYLDVDFISVAYNPGKSIRINSVLTAHWISRNLGKEVVFTLASRDMNKIATQSLLLGAALVDLQNIVVVKGDDFSKTELATVKPVDDFRPTELLRSIKSMNAGFDFKGSRLQSRTEFCAGATIDLALGLDKQVELTRSKVEAGAEFFLLQSLFDTGPVTLFLERYANRYGEVLSTPIFCGVHVMAPGGIVFGQEPDWVRKDMERGRTGEDIALEVLHKFVDDGFRSIYLVPPVLAGGQREYSAAQGVIETFKSQIRQR